MTQEKFPVELIMEEGRIVEIVSLNEEVVFVEDPVPSLDMLKVEGNRCEMQHGTILLSGQNSPGCFTVLTPFGYTRV